VISIKSKRWFQFFNHHWPWLILMATVVIAWWLAHRQFNAENNKSQKSTDSTATVAAAGRLCVNLH
jgi:prolipoprotein diacylglyceryltransferase